MSRPQNIFTGWLALLILAATTGSVAACSTCYGDPSSAMSTGLTWAITALVGVVGCVLAGVVAFFVRTIRRSARDGGNNVVE